MTERGARQVRRESSSLSMGRSRLHWTGAAMDIFVDEVCAPLPRRLRGSLRLTPAAMGNRSFLLDAAGRHRWTPLAPGARIEVRFIEPDISWSGIAYLDSNAGTEPLENAFQHWNWSRTGGPGETVVLYDVTPRTVAEGRVAGTSDWIAAREGIAAPGNDAQQESITSGLALRFGADGAHAIEPPPTVTLPQTRWRIARRTRADAGHGARVVATLEDAPFYSRSLLNTCLLGRTRPAIHESLDLDRFSARWVQCLLPFRMPRRLF